MGLVKNINQDARDYSADIPTNSEELARNQWALISDLEDEYRGRLVSNSSSKYEDDVWVGGEQSEDGRVYWNNKFNKDEKALKVVIKTVVFDMARSKSQTVGTIRANLSIFMNTIVKYISDKSLLRGKNGEYLLGINQLTDDDLLKLIDSQINAKSKRIALTVAHQIESFIHHTNLLADMLPFMFIDAKLPWEKSNSDIKRWVELRYDDINVSEYKEIGYEPLPPETVMPLIDRSLSLIQDYSDDVVAIQNEWVKYKEIIKNMTWNDAVTPKKLFAEKVLTEHQDIFKNRALLEQDLNPQKKQHAQAILEASEEILYLARGACVNILLLTTGLRNVDLRNLRNDCCNPSGRADILYYLTVGIKKTKNVIHVPVPEQTNETVKFLHKLKISDSEFLLDCGRIERLSPVGGKLNSAMALNTMIRIFADHFSIPFDRITLDGSEHSAHCYRTTVAGWLGAASNLSVLLVRRLFGHGNDIMPTTYLKNNPAFVLERQQEKERVASRVSREMALAASKGNLAGSKGLQLERGFVQYKNKCHSLTDTEILSEFANMLKVRMLDESMNGFMTPFGMRCIKSPNDTSQSPCASRANKDKLKDADKRLLDLVSNIDPPNCIGAECKEGMIGPWSVNIRESLLWYMGLLEHQFGEFDDETYRENARGFIRQYLEPVKKVFGNDFMKLTEEDEA